MTNLVKRSQSFKLICCLENKDIVVFTSLLSLFLLQWMYIVPLVLFLMMSGAQDQSGGGAGGGAANGGGR